MPSVSKQNEHAEQPGSSVLVGGSARRDTISDSHSIHGRDALVNSSEHVSTLRDRANSESRAAALVSRAGGCARSYRYEDLRASGKLSLWWEKRRASRTTRWASRPNVFSSPTHDILGSSLHRTYYITASKHARYGIKRPLSDMGARTRGRMVLGA